MCRELASSRGDQRALTSDGECEHAPAFHTFAPRGRPLDGMHGGAVAWRGRADGRAAGRQPIPAAPESAAGRDRQEDRGHRVLFLWLPALRRIRADPAGLAQDGAAGRAVPPHPGDVPGSLGAAGEDLLHARGARRGVAPFAGCVRRAAREGASAVAGQDVLRLGGEPGSRPQEGRGHVQLVRDRRQGQPRPHGGAGLQDPVGAA